MVKLVFVFILTGMTCSVAAQLVNNGGSIAIQPGASVIFTGSFTNAAGTVTNDGKLEVQGNFINTGTYTSSTNADTLIMSGNGNALLSPGGAVLSFLSINKAGSSDAVTLGGPLVITNKLDYLSGVLFTDYIVHPTYVLSAPASAVFNFAPGQEIIGSIKRTGWVSGASIIFNSPQLQITTYNGTTPTDMTVTMLPEAYGGGPSQAEREVKRRFLFVQTGGSGFTADVRLPYAAAELNTNNENNLVPWILQGAEWNARLGPVTRDIANKWVAAMGVDANAFNLEWKLADPRYTFNVTAYLRGSWNGTGMSAAINSILPTAQPYNVTPLNLSVS